MVSQGHLAEDTGLPMEVSAFPAPMGCRGARAHGSQVSPSFWVGEAQEVRY